jgi:endonuclease/exonuclease/phosphatase family metal-dependent hydrolase
MGWVMTAVRHLRRHLFGNVVLSRFPIANHSQYDLSWRTCEPRACQRADLDLGQNRALHVYNVHLGTAVLERRYQAPRLASYVHDHRVKGPKIILGDFNEWMRGLATRTLSSLFESIDIHSHLKRRRTYPGIFPVVHLDHIYYEGDVEVHSVELPRNRKALMASDHLPLVANLRIGFKS